MGIVIFIIVGAIAGFAASKVVRGKGMGLIWDIVVGILGAFLGGWLASLVGISARPARSRSAGFWPPSSVPRSFSSCSEP
jgi:uncharacterized membrane protein YeaQ/YmgE (transglycosylase-associated protein family)